MAEEYVPKLAKDVNINFEPLEVVAENEAESDTSKWDRIPHSIKTTVDFLSWSF
jgi:hypothetical protein